MADLMAEHHRDAVVPAAHRQLDDLVPSIMDKPMPGQALRLDLITDVLADDLDGHVNGFGVGKTLSKAVEGMEWNFDGGGHCFSFLLRQCRGYHQHDRVEGPGSTGGRYPARPLFKHLRDPSIRGCRICRESPIVDDIRPTELDRELFDRLAAATGEALISIYLPTHVKGAEIGQDRIRLKNGISDAEARLDEAGWSPRDRSALLESARDLLEDEDFWKHQRPALGVFVDSKGETTPVSLIEDTMERTVVSGVFHLRPAVPSLHPPELPVLVLSKGGVRLYRITGRQVRRVEADLPESFEDVNWFVDRERQRQRHPDKAGTTRGRHGHEGGYRDEDLDRFLRAVATALPDAGPEPLVVLGDDNLPARFDDISDRETVSPSNGGVGEVDDVVEIVEKTAPVLESHRISVIEARRQEAEGHLGSGNSITDLDEGLQAAVAGRISGLLIDEGADPVWGEFDPTSLEIARHEKEELFDVDLLDRLVVHAMGTGAEVTTTEGPIDGHVFVAIPRY